MGLDITAYRKLTPDPDAKRDEDGEPVDYDNHYCPGAGVKWSQKEWPERAPELNHETVYSFEDAFGFRAGSYSGYNQWRATLAEFAASIFTGGRLPFGELIDFADNEGAIGTATSARLAEDFATHQASAEEWASWTPTVSAHGGWFINLYGQWRKAFEMAADGGAVDFH